MIAMTAPEKPITHAELIAKSEVRRIHATSRNNTNMSPNVYHHVLAITDTARLSPNTANLSMLDAMFGKADIGTHIEELEYRWRWST